jgi:hypothetical protein
MFRLEFRLCGPLVRCLAEIGAESLSAVTSFVDAEALEELAKAAGAVRVVVGDYAVPARCTRSGATPSAYTQATWATST